MSTLCSRAAVLALSFAASLSACATTGGAGRDAARADAGLPRLGVFTSDAAGFDTHSFYLDTGAEVVVFDAQFTPQLADQLIAQIQAETSSPITTVVITHPNPDKFNGAARFQALGAKVVASAATAAAIPSVHAYKKGYFVNVAKMFTDATYPAEAKIDVVFSGSFSLPLLAKGQSVELHELAHAGVSSTQTVAFIPTLDALIVGDLVHHRTHAWLEGPIVDGAARPDLAAWRAALDELRRYPATTTVYGGRGPSATLDAAIGEQQAYLSGMEQLVRDYLAGLGSATAELTTDQAGVHWKAITARAVAAYPGYALPYMVEYSVYGLAFSLLR